MEQTINLLIFIQVGFRGIALLAGFVSIIAKKGLELHKKSGPVFFTRCLLQPFKALRLA